MRQIEAASEGLGADEDVDFAGFDGIVKIGEVIMFIIIAIEAGDFAIWVELFELGFEELGAEAFVNDAGMVTIRAGRGDFGLVIASMARESIRVGMEDERQETIRAESLPAAFFAKCHRGGTASIMKNESLMVSLDIVFYGCQ